VVRGFRPPTAPEAKLRVLVDGTAAADAMVSGPFAIDVPVTPQRREAIEIEIACESEPGWAKAAGDDRDLAFIFTELRVRHPAGAELE
jgi:hypothetical protein